MVNAADECSRADYSRAAQSSDSNPDYGFSTTKRKYDDEPDAGLRDASQLRTKLSSLRTPKPRRCRDLAKLRDLASTFSKIAASSGVGYIWGLRGCWRARVETRLRTYYVEVKIRGLFPATLGIKKHRVRPGNKSQSYKSVFGEARVKTEAGERCPRSGRRRYLE